VIERNQNEELRGARYCDGLAEGSLGRGKPHAYLACVGRKGDPAQSDKIKRDSHFWEWAWVDSNYRPHAYQAPLKRAKSRHIAVLSRVGRTICRTFPANMPEYAGIYRPNDRPK